MINIYFKFIDGNSSYNTADVFYVRMNPDISEKMELLSALKYQLWLPSYFGNNWDALYDCLCDFRWIPFHKIVIDHEKLPNLDDNALQAYLEILRDAIMSWKGDNRHCLEVVFQATEMERIEKLLAASQ